ncbi:prenyltransferase [Micrococcales bacterium 31B]|nr:prenyltransferase [Micrococcales bacterium 31B]
MTYTYLAGAVLAALALAAAGLWRYSGRAVPPRLHWAAVAACFAVLLVLTAIFDTLLIHLGFFSFGPGTTLGVTVGLAPIEDFTYPLAGLLILPLVFQILSRREGEVRRILWSSRPVSWINTAYPFGAAYLLAGGSLDWAWLLGCLFFLVPYNLAMYGINDVFDYASDLANPRKGGIEGALLDTTLHRATLASAVWSCVPFVVALVAAGGPATWLWLAASLFAVVAYSAPRLRFKERAVIDSLTSSFHFVSPAVVGLALAADRGAPLVIDAHLVTVLVAFYAWGMAAHAFGAVQDVRPDRAAGIGSVATVIGARATVRLAVVLWVLAGVAMLGQPWPVRWAALICVPYVINAAGFWNVTDDTAEVTNRGWRRFMGMNYASGFVATMVIIAHVRGWGH